MRQFQSHKSVVDPIVYIYRQWNAPRLYKHYVKKRSHRAQLHGSNTRVFACFFVFFSSRKVSATCCGTWHKRTHTLTRDAVTTQPSMHAQEKRTRLCDRYDTTVNVVYTTLYMYVETFNFMTCAKVKPTMRHRYRDLPGMRASKFNQIAHKHRQTTYTTILCYLYYWYECTRAFSKVFDRTKTITKTKNTYILLNCSVSRW